MSHGKLNVLCQLQLDIIANSHKLWLFDLDDDFFGFLDVAFFVTLHKHRSEIDRVPTLAINFRVKWATGLLFFLFFSSFIIFCLFMIFFCCLLITANWSLTFIYLLRFLNFEWIFGFSSRLVFIIGYLFIFGLFLTLFSAFIVWLWSLRFLIGRFVLILIVELFVSRVVFDKYSRTLRVINDSLAEPSTETHRCCRFLLWLLFLNLLCFLCHLYRLIGISCSVTLLVRLLFLPNWLLRLRLLFLLLLWFLGLSRWWLHICHCPRITYWVRLYRICQHRSLIVFSFSLVNNDGILINLLLVLSLGIDRFLL